MQREKAFFKKDRGASKIGQLTGVALTENRKETIRVLLHNRDCLRPDKLIPQRPPDLQARGIPEPIPAFDSTGPTSFTLGTKKPGQLLRHTEARGAGVLHAAGSPKMRLYFQQSKRGGRETTGDCNSHRKRSSAPHNSRRRPPLGLSLHYACPPGLNFLSALAGN